ncbi:type I-A CRISPR-associated protein Cas7/Csa2 [Caldivirga sp.]|uniref:type I-A CRISPR-associated protein Cas7/Csa2 n=1 Tax=Caldivirga sp. TaxID=2080243 RepID=UPI003D111DA8
MSSNWSKPSNRSTLWLSFSARYLVNVEDLNNVESAGNYVRHRRAPLVYMDNGSYVVSYVPAISGEMIAHGYQENLVLVARQLNLPVDSLAEQGYFIKRGSDDKLHEGTKCSAIKNTLDYEKCVIEEDVIEDVAGFLNPNKVVKRVSNIAFSYMIPALDAVKKATLTPQFHVRYAPQAQRGQQSIYNIEVGSSSYIVTGYLDIGGIGCTQNQQYQCISDRLNRVNAALGALVLTLTQFMFGAKRTRVNPVIDIEAVMVTLGEKPFNAAPLTLSNGKLDDTVKLTSGATASLKNVLGMKRAISIYLYSKPGLTGQEIQGVKYVDNPVKVFDNVKEEINKIMGEGSEGTGH